MAGLADHGAQPHRHGDIDLQVHDRKFIQGQLLPVHLDFKARRHEVLVLGLQHFKGIFRCRAEAQTGSPPQSKPRRNLDGLAGLEQPWILTMVGPGDFPPHLVVPVLLLGDGRQGVPLADDLELGAVRGVEGGY